MSRRSIRMSDAEVCLYVTEALNRRAVLTAQVKVAFISNKGTGSSPNTVEFTVDDAPLEPTKEEKA